MFLFYNIYKIIILPLIILKKEKYIKEKGIKTIRSHASDFINTKLAPANSLNDDKQTPMKNHPVFVATHACACCCRPCLFKGHYISKNKELNNNEQEYILNLSMKWKGIELKKYKISYFCLL